MTRPKNPYRKGTMIHALMEGALEGEFDGKAGWEDMTLKEIAETLGKSERSVESTLSRIWYDTGYDVAYKRTRYRNSRRKTLNSTNGNGLL